MDTTRSDNHAAREARRPPGRQRHPRLWLMGVLIVPLAGLAAAGHHFGCSRSTEFLPPAIATQPGAAAGFNVVLFTLDTLRADRLGCYGYRGVETPTLDALAAGGVRFADAVTTVPVTLPAHATIMTGDYPPVHGVRNNGSYRLLERYDTLAERLQAEGCATAAFIATFVLDKRYGLDQGFDLYDDDVTLKYRTPGGLDPSNPQRPANVVIDSAIEWLGRHQETRSGQPFFMWIHLFDPHTPYTPPEPFRTRYASAPYDGEVAFTDQQVGRFLDSLRECQLIDKTVIVAVGDHGEGLGDHGEREHGLLVYESTMRVPLVFYGPVVIPAGRVVNDRVVSTVDVAPTIRDLLGLEVGDGNGLSLLRATSPSDRAVYVESLYPKLKHGWSPLYGLRRHQDKYIAAPTPEYYDLITDPGEARDLLAQRPTEARVLADRLQTIKRSFPSREQISDAAVTPDAEALRKLAALGYVGGEVAPSIGPPPNPKEMVRLWHSRLETLRQLTARGRFVDAIPLLRNALDATPHDPELWLLLSDMQTKVSLYEDAVASRLKAIELLGSAGADEWVQLARLQHTTGDVAAVVTSLSEAERLDRDHGEVSLIRAQLSLDAGQYEEALAHCAEARRRDSTRFTARSWLVQAKVYESMGAPVKAAAADARAHEADPFSAAVLLDQAEAALREGQFHRAIQLAQRVLPEHARWGDARTLVARAHVRLGQGDRAVQVMKQRVEAQSTNAWAHNNFGNVLQELGSFDEAAACYAKAVELDPGLATARYNFALLLDRQGKPEQAVEHLREVVALEPSLHSARCELARMLSELGELDEAVRIIEQVLQSAPHYAAAYPQAANLLLRQTRPARAIEVLGRGRSVLPKDPGIANYLAWLLATSPDSKLRDGPRAVELARLADELTGGSSIAVLDTLAAAYAEAGRFDEAVATANRARKLARQADDDDMAAAIEARLDLYQQQQAYHGP